ASKGAFNPEFRLPGSQKPTTRRCASRCRRILSLLRFSTLARTFRNRNSWIPRSLERMMMIACRRFLSLFSLLLIMICGYDAAGGGAEPRMTKTGFGRMPDGQSIDLCTLTNRNGMKVTITNYGGRVVSLFVPDRAGKVADVVLGFDDLSGYLEQNPY